MPKVNEVNFIGLHNGQELYATTRFPKKFFLRQPTQDANRVIWHKAKKGATGYEAVKPVKAGAYMRVVKGHKKDKEVLYVEMIEAELNGDTFSPKVGMLADDQLDAISKAVAADYCLHTFEQWKKWLLEDRTRLNYKGSEDNWLYFGTDLAKDQHPQFHTVDVFGVPYHVYETPWKHMASGKTWTVVQLRLPNEETEIRLCGYGFKK